MRSAILFSSFLLFGSGSFAQDGYRPDTSTGNAPDTSRGQRMTFKWAPTGLLLGSLTLQGEYHFTKRSSLIANIGLPLQAKHSLSYVGQSADFRMKATSFLAGYRRYFSRRRPMAGLYLEPYFKYVHHTSEGEGQAVLDGRATTVSFINNYNAFGLGVQLGAQFRIGKRAVIDLFFLGPEINSASDRFSAREQNFNRPWTGDEGQKAKRDVLEFIDQFPFINNRVNVVVEEQSRTVRASFRGALPGFRAGVSLGVAL
ncbi:hypothetical protein [Flaviaesturariibacter amylovorans]